MSIALEHFKQVIKNYRNAVHQNYISRMGDEDSLKPPKQNVIDWFYKVPEQKEVLFFWIFKIMNKQVEKDEFVRFNHWCQTLANELVDELWVD